MKLHLFNNNFFTFIYSLMLLTLITYPGSPVLFQLLIYEHQISYMFFCIIITIINALHYENTNKYIFYSILLFLAIVLASGKLISVRESALLICAISLVSLSCKTLERIINNIVLISVTLIIVNLVLISFVDLEEWKVLDLSYLAPQPIQARQIQHGFEYYMPFYLTVQAIFPEENILNFYFSRNTYFFSEATMVWLTFLPLFFYLLSKNISIKSAFYIFIFIVALATSLSMTGLIAMITSYIVLNSRSKAIKIILLLPFVIYFKEIMYYFPAKYAQISQIFDIYYQFDLLLSDNYKSYGVLFIIKHYGFFVIIPYAIINIYIISKFKYFNKYEKMALLSSMIIYLRINQITVLLALLMFSYFYKKHAIRIT
jgi:hypothetical protein